MENLVVVGSGMGALSAAALLAKKGMRPLVLEQNWIPGGCTSSYWRKGYVFETGATTLVGLDAHMPLRYLLDELGLELPVRKLELPMQVHLADGRIISKYEPINQWIVEAERHFSGRQREFWQLAYRVSQFVWDASTRFRYFPPSRWQDWLQLARNARPADLWFARYVFKTTAQVLNDFGLNDPVFRKYVDEQLLITAQNKADEVNFLFGAAALCYTNYGNYYLDGGLIHLVSPLIDYILANGGQVHYREKVLDIRVAGTGYQVTTDKGAYLTKRLISGIPLNNMKDVAPNLVARLTPKILPSEKLYSAFQMGIGFVPHRSFSSLHHQIHLEVPLSQTGSQSIFVSLNHPEDRHRSDEPGHMVASVSTHLPHPFQTVIDPPELENIVVGILEKHDILHRNAIRYQHSSGPRSWQKWTGRAFGFVGGYPQYFGTRPWQMVDHRLDGNGAYLCGDSTYPGQGIPGATLSGIIATHKLLADSTRK